MVQADPWKNSDPPDLSVRIYKGILNVDWEGVQHTHCGLLNLGSSCYLNATVQVSAAVEMVFPD